MDKKDQRGEDMKEDIEIEESEKEIYNKKAIKATENRTGMEEIQSPGAIVIP